MLTPFYDPGKSYEDNYNQGPFGVFADGEVIQNKQGQSLLKFNFLGFKVNSPFGIAAGPLFNGKFCKAAFDKGFDICVYKTVRTREKKSNIWPNVVPVDVTGDLSIEQAKKGLVIKKEFTEPLAITNSFGNPCFPPEVWQKDIAETVEWMKNRPGQLLCTMIEGTRWEANATDEDFINDWVLTAKMMKETGAQVIEANFSCPNESNFVTSLLCFDVMQSKKIAKAIKKEIGDVRLVIKISYFESDEELRSFVKELGEIVDGISAINTIQAKVYDEHGNQALPGGEWRLKSGICGAPIKWAAIDMVKKLKKLREELGYKYSIIGVGGVITPEDFLEYREAGADAVMSATGAMWNPYLAKEIKERLE